MIDPRVASGLRDIPPSAMIPRERMLEALRRTFASFGFVPIETPHIERMEVLTGKGAGSDEVLRQIFEVTNKGGTPGELALRFDLTVPLARFVAKHIDQLGTPFKRYAIGSVFRGERPAKGRFREFTQCDFDTVGTTSEVSDAETALVIYSALTTIGVPKFTITLNHRAILNGLLDIHGLAARTGPVLRALDKYDKIGRVGVLKELMRDHHPAAPVPDPTGAGEITSVMDQPGDAALSEDFANIVLDFVEQGRGGQEVLENAERILVNHNPAKDGISNLRSVIRLLDSAGVPGSHFAINLGLARGLDYYTGIVFETIVDGWERFGSIASGGRYDDLASLFIKRRLPGVGASIGLDRLIALMDEAGWLPESATTAPVLVANFPGVDPATPFRLAARLRAAGTGAEVYPEPISIGKQMGYGSTRGHTLAVIVGPDEEAKEVFNLRILATRHEDKGLAWSTLEDSVHSALEFLEHLPPRGANG